MLFSLDVLIEHNHIFQRDVQLSARNIAEEMSMHVINLEEEGGKFFLLEFFKIFEKITKFSGMLSAFQKYFDSIVIPQITNNDKWGALDENEQGIVFLVISGETDFVSIFQRFWSKYRSERT